MTRFSLAIFTEWNAEVSKRTITDFLRVVSVMINRNKNHPRVSFAFVYFGTLACSIILFTISVVSFLFFIFSQPHTFVFFFFLRKLVSFGDHSHLWPETNDRFSPCSRRAFCPIRANHRDTNFNFGKLNGMANGGKTDKWKTESQWQRVETWLTQSDLTSNSCWGSVAPPYRSPRSTREHPPRPRQRCPRTLRGPHQPHLPSVSFRRPRPVSPGILPDSLSPSLSF